MASKRPRLEAPSESEKEQSSGSFKFGFTDPVTDAQSNAVKETETDVNNIRSQEVTGVPYAAPARWAEVLTDTGEAAWGSTAIADVRLRKGSIVKVHWEHPSSIAGWLHVTSVATEGTGTSSAPPVVGSVPTSALRLLPTTTDVSTHTLLSGHHDDHVLRQIDTVFPTQQGTPPLHSILPLVIEPGLDSLIWPVNPRTFLQHHWRQKALCVHASASRLSSLADDMGKFNVPDLIATASRLVVWMRETGPGGRMNYLDAGATVGLACWRAGHTLYFNPPQDMQNKYIGALAADVGMDFAADLAGEGSTDPEAQDGGGKGPGGDIEVFAVKGEHHTPWHFDAQENFTLQLRGTKRWSFRPSGMPDPLTNLHPSSAGTSTLHEDMKVHRAADSAIHMPLAHLAPGKPVSFAHDDPEVRTVLLRPGSFLYVPAGWYHKVDAEEGEGEEAGSLSCNFSMVGARWIELLVRRLVPYLVGADARWRGRITVPNGSADAARAHLEGLLSTLPTLLSKLHATDFLPGGIFNESRAPALLVLPHGMELGQGKRGQAGASHAGRKRRRASASDGLLEGADEDDEDGVSTRGAGPDLGLDKQVEAAQDQYGRVRWPHNVGMGIVHRCPLSVMVLDGEPMGKVSSITLPVPVTQEEREGQLDTDMQSPPPTFVKCTLHAGFGSLGGEPAPSDFAVTLTVPAHLHPVLSYLSRLPPFASVPVKELESLVQGRTGAGAGVGVGQGKGGAQAGTGMAATQEVHTLVALLVHNGYLGWGVRS